MQDPARRVLTLIRHITDALTHYLETWSCSVLIGNRICDESELA
jgi:hypothetical protein